MARKPINLHKRVRDILGHSAPPSSAAERPLAHFDQSAAAGFLLIDYIEENMDKESVNKTIYHRQMGHLRRMVLSELLAAFERFLREIAAVCIDILAPFAVDDRFDEFLPRTTGNVAAFVNAKSIGKALCETGTWLRHEAINRRFRRLLKLPFGELWEFLFPEGNQPPAAEQERSKTLAILWQVRHCCAHNVGFVSESDAMKFRMLVGAPVRANRSLTPTATDLRYIKKFLAETAISVNQRIGHRLAQVLEQFHMADPTLFDAQSKANEVSQRFALAVTISRRVGVF